MQSTVEIETSWIGKQNVKEETKENQRNKPGQKIILNAKGRTNRGVTKNE